ncbi:MAG: DUF885 domain-containing protein, partial [Ekhidna sp.]
MKKCFRYSIILVLLSNSLLAQSGKKLSKIFAEIDEVNKSYSVRNTIWSGKHPKEYTFQRVDAKIETADKLRGKLELLSSIPDDKLSDQNKINKQIKILQLRNSISQIDYKIYLIPFNSEGGFFNSPSFFLPNLPFESIQDYDDYLEWLPSFTNFITYNKSLLQNGIDEKIQAPKVIVKNIISLLEPWTTNELYKNPFYQPIKNIPSDISEKDRKRIEDQAAGIIKGKILPVYLELMDFLKNQYLVSAPEKIGIGEIKNGKAYYENRVQHFSTLNISPDSVFTIGEAEVSRIRKQMENVITELDFKGSFADFLQFLRTDEQFYAKSGQELLNYAAWLSKKAEGELPRLFSKLYELPFTVAPVPENIAPNYTSGRYSGGSRTQNKSGAYWVNTYNLSSRTLYTLPALTLHEAVPGHHLQIQIASELEDIPDFRRTYYISAFGEGWGLYAEYLGEEMGMYETPYDLFGRYTYEMWRACRLVVDVGMHYKGWTREEAINFMSKNTALSLHEVNTEIDRYIGWPGQALSYKLGELMIKKLRSRAETKLGERFSIQEFHNTILRNGSVPLPILEEQVDKY